MKSTQGRRLKAGCRMGKYLNAGNENFRRIRQGTYVDKTGLISEVNRRIGTTENLVYVSRH